MDGFDNPDSGLASWLNPGDDRATASLRRAFGARALPKDVRNVSSGGKSRRPRPVDTGPKPPSSPYSGGRPPVGPQPL